MNNAAPIKLGQGFVPVLLTPGLPGYSCTLFPVPCSLYPPSVPGNSYSLLPTPYCLLPIPYSLLPIPYCLYPTPYSLTSPNTAAFGRSGCGR